MVNIFLNGTCVRSRVNLVHFKGAQLDPYETYMMKLTCCTWDCLLEHAAHSRHITQIGIYFILRNNWHTDVPWNISKIFYWISFFSVQHMIYILSCMIFLFSISCKLYILWIGVLDWHIHCARVWYEIIKIVEHSIDFHLRSCKPFDKVENVSGNIFFDRCRILFWNFEICTISIFWKDMFIYYFKEMFRLLNCLHIFADFVLFLYARLKNGTYYAVAMSVRLSVSVFRTFLQHALRYQFETWYIHSVGGTTCRVWVASQLGHFDLVYIQK